MIKQPNLLLQFSREPNIITIQKSDEASLSLLYSYIPWNSRNA